MHEYSSEHLRMRIENWNKTKKQSNKVKRAERMSKEIQGHETEVPSK